MKLDQASWIWTADAPVLNHYVDFRADFDLGAGERAEMELSVDGNYALYLNGEFVDCGQYPDYPEYKVYDRLKLDAEEGKNELLIRAYWPGEDHFSYRVEKPGLLFAVYAGEKLLCMSGEGVLCATNRAFVGGELPKLTPQLGYTFLYDARKATNDFKPAVVVEKEVSLKARPIWKLQIGERLPATLRNCGVFFERKWEKLGQRMQNAALAPFARMAAPLSPEAPAYLETDEGDGVWAVLDLGAEQVGFLDLELDLPCDALVLGGYGEHLDDLRVRSFVGGRNFAFTYYGVKGENRFFMPLRRLGLRYLQLHIYAPSVTLRYAGVRPATYPLREHPIPIADKLHHKIYEACVRTLRMCMHDHYEDSPWREQGLYTMDSRNEMLCTYDVFHDSFFPKACLRMIGLGVREDGMAELCSPSRAPITIPFFTAVYLVQLAEYYDYNGDAAFLTEMLPAARKVAEGFAARIDESGLIAAYEEPIYWNFYEWQDGLDCGYGVKDPDERTYDAPLCAAVSMAFSAMAHILRVLGLDEEAARYEKLRDNLNRRAHEAFWNGTGYSSFKKVKGGALSHFCQLTQALMILCGACPDEHKKQVRELLKAGADVLLPVTLSYSVFKYDALMTDPANKQWMLGDVAEIWGNMLFEGSTTFWETADGAPAFANAGSLCHGWSAVPLHLYYKYGV